MTDFIYKIYQPEDLLSHFSTRKNETRIGEKINTGLNNSAQYAIIGVCEDIGPQSNLGRPGASKGFHAFLSRFLNMQSTHFISATNLTIVGEIQQNTSFTTIEAGNKQVESLDLLVSKCVSEILEAGKTPILIGGGHNNALPLIKATHDHYQESIDVVNLDPHADTRPTDGRHSGNSFSYGLENNWIDTYAVLGLHKPFNSSFILNFLEQKKCYFTFFEDYILNQKNLESDISHLERSSGKPLGIELDMDSIAYMPSSAMGPSGWQMEDARKYILLLKQSKRKIAYLHLTEAAPTTPDEMLIVGKALAYLIYDFTA